MSEEGYKPKHPKSLKASVVITNTVGNVIFTGSKEEYNIWKRTTNAKKISN